ncbi:MAG: hypothetical protein H0T79_23165, partial [Deltaproteobacteria bacterium]|nr:hypothetical protein [Deltaproteobacteria bacterium]
CEDADGTTCCSGCMFVAFSVECRAAAGACDLAEVCDGLSATCPADAQAPEGAACVGGFCTNGTCANCNPAVDADFDGANQCLDCNDTNGLVFPAASEKACDGLDDDCDGTVDEDYDQDVDGYSVCSDDPLVRDCDDTRATVHPGAPELCGAGIGNGRDDNCNGYIDETCTTCDTVDNDGDGASECQGDCNDTQATVGPGKPEACDGFDTDCNTFTTENCDVSDACNFVGGADECKENLECGCVVGLSGQCTGDYRCSSFCEGSYTGPIGAGCTATQTCLYRWTLSDNQHACVETTATLGTKLGGEVCTQASECRSGDCDNYCIGLGCQVKRCVDYCDHHAVGAAGSCATGTVCEIQSSTLIADRYMYASCRLADNGPRVTGESCTGGCAWGAQSCVNNVCAQPCGDDAQCPAAFHCSLAGNQVVAGTWGAGSPVGVTGQPAIETVPVCLADSGAGMHDRPGGSACAVNGDCESQYCERTQHVCVDPCISDASCAIGLTCEPRYVRAKPGVGSGVVWGRVCANDSFGDFLQPL